MQFDGRWTSRSLAAALLAATALVSATALAQDQAQPAASTVESRSQLPGSQPVDAIATPAAGPAATAASTGTPVTPPLATATSEPPASATPPADRVAAPAPVVTATPSAPQIASPVNTPEPAATPSATQSAPLEAGAAPIQLDMAAALARVSAKGQADKRDRDAVAAFYAKRDGRPLWMTAKGAAPEALKLAAEFDKAEDWGIKATSFDVPALSAAKADAPAAPLESLADAEARLSLAALKYARLARGGRVEPAQITKFLDRKSQSYAPGTVLDGLAAAADPGEYLQSLNPRHEQFQRLRQAWLALGSSRSGPEGQRLLANMEQWRWMPDDLGSFHVTVNVPEMQLRVMRDGKSIHTERVIIGKLDTQTPIFSDEMEQVIFHPFWGVPDSIKQNEVLPSLRGNGAVLVKHNLRIQSGGRDIDPKAVDWSKTDIRKLHVYQPPGADNVLGVVKFRFPNKHDVYMHDTPSKSLFKTAVRTYSHGCMRVQNPVRLAELVLAEDRRMSPDKVQALTRKDAPENNQLNLSRRVPVHITYFTATVDDAGKVTTFKDIYGHEERIRLALDGRMNLIKPVPEPKGPERAEPVGQLVEINTKPSDWARRAFSGSDAFGVSGGN